MQTTIRLRWWTAVLLLSGCRSEQAAFSFRPAPTVISRPAARPIPPAAYHPPTPNLPATPTPATLTPVAPSVIPSVAARPMFRPRLGPARRPRLATSFRHPVVARRQAETVAVTRPHAPRRHDVLHVVLGALLIVGGVVAGLALGGWLGMGVGAVVVLLGYYFVVLGIGGKHAWLEIFQEFFNM